MIVGGALWPCDVTFRPTLVHPEALHAATRLGHDATAQFPAPLRSDRAYFVHFVGLMFQGLETFGILLSAFGATSDRGSMFVGGIVRPLLGPEASRLTWC